MNALAMPTVETGVAALFVDPSGVYPGLVADTWDAERDARKYSGPLPVVAHPPCQLWVNFAALNYKRYGGERNRPGNDGGLGKRAANQTPPAFAAWLIELAKGST